MTGTKGEEGFGLVEVVFVEDEGVWEEVAEEAGERCFA